MTNIEIVKPVKDLHCHCPALSTDRAETLGNPKLQDLADLSDCDIAKINSFIRASSPSVDLQEPQASSFTQVSQRN